MRNILIALLFFAAIPAEAKPWCKDADTIGTKCRIKIEDLRPLQGSVGMIDVQEKQDKVQKLLKKSKAKLAKYLKKNPVEVVIGPGGEFFIVDGHHLAKALYLEDIPEMDAKVIGNFRNKSMTEFQNILEERGWVRLMDENGKPLKTLADLPQHVRWLKEDAYRSLAWLLRKSGVFLKTSVKFAEFLWGDCFRDKGLKIEPGIRGMDEAYEKAVEMIRDKKCGPGLPGYLDRMKTSVTFHACAASYNDLRGRNIRIGK
jgi:hypothetical protein